MADARFGVFLSPAAHGLDGLERLVQAAEGSGFDYVSIQDHPYVPDFLDTFTLVAHLAARTSRIRFMTNVANLPLRPAPMLAKAAATIDRTSRGRFDLGLGGGHSWDEITALGGPRWTPGETVAAVDAAIDTLRASWRPGGAGPEPDHPVGIWLGAGGPRMLDLLGRKADGWIAPMRSDRAARTAGQHRIDAAARAAGRDPRSVERVVQVVGLIDPGTDPLPMSCDLSGGTAVRATPDDWTRLAVNALTEERFDAVNLIPAAASPDQVRRFGEDVLPRVREATR